MLGNGKKTLLPLFAVLSLPLVAGAALPGAAEPAGLPELVRIEESSITYRLPGEYLVGRTATNAPLEKISLTRPFEIMRRQVTAGEYGRCVEAGGCLALDAPQAGGPRNGAPPVAGDEMRSARQQLVVVASSRCRRS